MLLDHKNPEEEFIEHFKGFFERAFLRISIYCNFEQSNKTPNTNKNGR